MRKIVIFLSLLLLMGTVGGQNITDLSVMHRTDVDSSLLNIGTYPSIVDTVFLHPDRVRYDHRCFQLDGKDTFIFSGTFHYFRVPQPLWADRFRKLKAAGFNCVETYIPWNWHERTMPRSVTDESQIDLRELNDFLVMAEEFGFYVILRPGPYICAEWSGGGFPQWIMQKKPAKPAFDVWLQSNDPEFMRWNEHWYRAVCRVVAPHQLIHKPVGGKGVILFQVENEFNRVRWFPKEAKKDYLDKLAFIARKYGIEVPIITCWTDESRNVETGILNGVVDMVNSYPRWQIEKNLGRLVDLQMKTQPGKPLISGELQGGWCCELGWQLSWKQDGLPPVQTQNITLYTLQRGFSALNFYMAVGGTNFDDWAARQQVTSYDYAAAIGEDGVVNERYRRFQGLSTFINEHGTRIARADLVSLDYITTDTLVKLALRCAKNGDRYYFVRTEERSRQHFGTIRTDDLEFDFALEPFGSMVYYLPAGATQGEWFPKLPDPQIRPATKIAKIELKKQGEWADKLPTKWTRLKKGEAIDNHGIYGRHFVYYKTNAFEGCTLEVGRIGKKVVNGSVADTVLVSVNGKLLPIFSETQESAHYCIPGDSLSGRRVEVILLFENKGLHHHTNWAVEKFWYIGPTYVRCKGKELPLSYAYLENERGVRYSSSMKENVDLGDIVGESLLKWYRYSFDLPQGQTVTSCFLKLAQNGNGFIYVNGHCIGRCWEQGPQSEYYIPECWLNTDKPNIVTVSLRPTAQGANVKVAGIKALHK